MNNYHYKQMLSPAISSKHVLNTNNSGTKTRANDAVIDVTIKGESLSHYKRTESELIVFHHNFSAIINVNHA
ncbi:hypothetical protein [Psychrobacter urativorans]|uniref:Uncharacterized protein n=1 Tax=Psychrobacter urativorans TaxID=45610 RepID=A0A0M5MJ80_9GAMM|nr:hypothetical protein [Psychrobacter urativorans]ALF58675.1 hypothetical protein AOC03_00295 [Psychrobacter urativorans]